MMTAGPRERGQCEGGVADVSAGQSDGVEARCTRCPPPPTQNSMYKTCTIKKTTFPFQEMNGKGVL